MLHSLYGVGTDITVTQTPAAGSGGPTGFGFRGRVGNQKRPASGTKIDIDNLTSIGQGRYPRRRSPASGTSAT